MPTPKTTKTTRSKLTRAKASIAAPAAARTASRAGSAIASSTNDVMSEVASESVVVCPTLVLPEPEELAKYEKIIPGGAERILELAEQQAAHHQEVEARQLETSAKLKLVKHIITFFLALGAGALGAALLLAGSELAGLLVIVIDAAALAAVSLYGHQS